MGLWDIYQAIRAEYPVVGAVTPIVIGLVAGWALAWLLLKTQLATYKTKLEVLQEVLDGKTPTSAYKAIRFRKERPVLAGIALAVVGVVLTIAGIVFVIANFKTVSPTQTTNEALKDSVQNPSVDSGPLVWFVNLTMEGGPLTGNNVFTLQFRGMNKSKTDVRMKSAEIISEIDNTALKLEIVVGSDIVPIDEVNAIPPGAPVTLVAKFGPPNPNAPGKILGLEASQFLDKWRSFTLHVVDDVTAYKVPYQESAIAPFFPNMVGPHVTKKAKP